MVVSISLERLSLVLFTTGLPVAVGGHDEASGVEKRLTAMRGVMVMPRTGSDCGERGQRQ